MHRFNFITAAVAAAVLFSSAPLNAARPARKTVQVYLADMYDAAEQLEKTGDTGHAEEKLIQIYNLARHDRYRSESQWLDYMKSVRTLFNFYMREANYKEAGWYYKLYSEELHGDPQAEKMFMLLVHQAVRPMERYMDKEQFQIAEDTLLYLNDFLEGDLEFNSYVFEVIFLNLTNLYLKMDLRDKAKECADRLNEIRGRETITIE